MSLDNYPDDIRSYDNHPQSPFYIEPFYEEEEELDFEESLDEPLDTKIDNLIAQVEHYEYQT